MYIVFVCVCVYQIKNKTSLFSWATLTTSFASVGKGTDPNV